MVDPSSLTLLAAVPHHLAGDLFPNSGPTAPSPQAASELSQIFGYLKWAAGAAAVIGMVIVVIMGVVAHRRGEGVMEHFGGFVKILGLLVVLGSALSVVSALVS
jgi:hypothetical protein